jgi:hypothetical protein
MPNAIKYNVSAETLALKKGNFWIGTGDVGKGPTSSTGFYNGITPPSGGYTIYLNKESGGPSIYTVTTEAQMVSLTNTIGAQSFTTSGQCLNWFATQTDKMIFNIDYPAVVTNGLVLHIDGAFTTSYPQSGNTVYNLVPSQYNGTLTNGPTWSSGSFIFDGTDDIIRWDTQPVTGVTNDITYNMWFNMNSTSGNQAFFSFRDSMITLNNGTQWNYWWNVAVSNGQITTSAIQTGTWYNMCLTQSGSSTTLYINGVAQASIVSGNIGTLRDAKAIGQYDTSPSAYNKYNGKISLAQIYNRCLTSSEVLQNYTVTKSNFSLDLQILVVAGAGGGGRGVGNNRGGGGGGAGGLQYFSANTTFIKNTNYTITLGAGGAAGVSLGSFGSNGNNSVFGSITSNGGGGGAGSQNATPNGLNGGSGGGASNWGNGNPTPAYGIGGLGISGQGFSGGSTVVDSAVGPIGSFGCGGGGAGSFGGIGGFGGNDDGKPGSGVTYNIYGVSILYSQGGRGGGFTENYNGDNGLTNQGYGGGGTRGGNNSTAGSGGSGVILFKLPYNVRVTFSNGVTWSSSTSNFLTTYVVTATSTTSETVSFS